MNTDSHDRPFWRLDQSTAELVDGNVQARVDLAHPQLGLQHLQIRGKSISGRLLCISATGCDAWSPSIGDVYVRGCDLVVSYKAVDDWPFAPQICWRVETIARGGGSLASLFVLISIQTDLLDTHPQIEIASELPADELLQLHFDETDHAQAEQVVASDLTVSPRANAGCLLRRLPGGQTSYAEVMLESDYRELQIGQRIRGNSRSAWKLFAEFLEKGVIRRARMAIPFMTRDNDVQLAAEFCRAMKRRPLPLTT